MMERRRGNGARDCNLDINVKDYAAHSFRRGGANALKEQGATPMEIQEHGRWTSECYRRYKDLGKRKHND